jgi:hypothetical protein
METSPNESSGIAYRANLPLGWRAETPDAARQAACLHANVALLRALAIIESAPSERDHEPDSPLARSMDRLEAKLDIAMSLLSRLAMQRVDMPPQVPVTLTSAAVEWSGEQGLPDSGDEVLITLYLSEKLPEPLQLNARVVYSAEGRCVAEILCRDPEFEEWLTRTLFRYHRRSLQARHHL